VTYDFQQSGQGCHDVLNDGRYCRLCKAAVNEALSAIPVRFECRYIPIAELPQFADVTREDITTWEADFWRLRRESKAIYGQRIWPALIDFSANDSQTIREVRATSGRHEGTRFRVSSWQKRPDYLIEVPMEWDLTRQIALGLWRESA
jgi:hypothetical protein